MSSRRRMSLPSNLPTHGIQRRLSNIDLKDRVSAFIEKLADRDMQALAAGELEAIAKSLSPHSLSAFLSCLRLVDSSSKPAVRLQVVNLLSVLSSSHGDALVPHLSKLLSILTSRLRDSDSGVRSACVSAATSLTINAFSTAEIFESLLDVLSTEQNSNTQLGAAMCLEAVVEAASSVSPENLRLALPRLRKLVTSDGFKPKNAVIGLIGSVVGAGGASRKATLDWLVPCLLKFLSSEDWASRNAAAKALGRVVLNEGNLAKGYRIDCLCYLEKRRFDKVKVVRETINRTLDLWKEISSESEDAPATSQSDSSETDFSKIGTETSSPHHKNIEPETTPVISRINSAKARRKSRIPSELKLNYPSATFSEDSNEHEDLSLLCKQLVQIESQQSNLLKLLQEYMGVSQKGIVSLETRVSGLERLLSEMSQGMALWDRQDECGGNVCCKLPGTEFWTPRFWKKTEARVSHGCLGRSYRLLRV